MSIPTSFLSTWQFWVLAVFVVSVLYINLRGNRRLSFVAQLKDHSTVMAPVNAFLALFSKIKTEPYPDRSHFPELQEIREHWQQIRDEAEALQSGGLIQAAGNNDDLGFNSFFKRGWTRFYLSWYGVTPPSAEQYAPFTCNLIKRYPNIRAAMFTRLPAGGELRQHRDPYGGSLRYHLGLSTPNSDDCHILVDGIPYAWRDGEDVIFDETYLHEVHNNTDQDRLIFFCDIEKPMRFAFATWFNRFFSALVLKASASPNQPSDKTGLLNRIYQLIYYRVTSVFKRLKRYNRNLYKVVKYALIMLVMAGFFYSWRVAS
ncbi:MAG: lipid A hydroxylase LpxO [Oceanospirillaceae bacterium]|uniref:aspartyl/asparaginyl beta-hydroxylase domain-containing protein n=1 Tax=unclassified Thalassolituus TaxID=2624967 RepID=UPI000C391838|nr:MULTISPECIES: aspartyl/asparaginyl beta-hydroxylase domain-containing protein [unclassified Thalassolituus]MBL34946.1 lipid A hydroxylase LpxO [Oceanospirillaceae bacterium]MBS52404.1 lipid A hydroxylase LpxO [Oceanospirillaceae bacterium]MBS53644.1 lipid A hydroxylase LpxO [Oceanospirillaceae bacterium]|tara:strand:+ start:1594 stop:2541 length:948 start_codon:yes stop_codon:yes gene_type:complete